MIDLIDVSKSYGPGLPAVNHANLHIDKGEFVFVVGNSGSGKTTLIKLLMKELDSVESAIRYADKALYHAKSAGRNCIYRYNQEEFCRE